MKFALPCFMVAVLLALVLGRFGVARLPQVVQGDDALSVAFGDAKSTISAAMVHKADSYFHGGIDMECKAHHDHHHDQSPNPPILQSPNPPLLQSPNLPHSTLGAGSINRSARRKSMCISRARGALS